MATVSKFGASVNDFDWVIQLVNGHRIAWPCDTAEDRRSGILWIGHMIADGWSCHRDGREIILTPTDAARDIAGRPYW